MAVRRLLELQELHDRVQPPRRARDAQKYRAESVASQRSIDVAARRLRQEGASRLAPQFLRNYTRSRAATLVASSPLRRHVEDFDAADPYRVLAFNLELTRSLVAELCASDLEAGLLAFTASRIAELGIYALFDPTHPTDDPRIYLAASKEWGYFVTPPEIALLLAERALGTRTRVRRALDPAAGTGSLLAALLLKASALDIEIESIHGIEADAFTAQICGLVVRRTAMLLGRNLEITISAADATDSLLQPDCPADLYDCIVMNPPYGRAKFLRSALTNAETRTSTTKRSLAAQDEAWKRLAVKQAERCRGISKQLGLGGGAQDYERIFIALALNALSPDGRLAFIAPSSWLGDQQAADLRGSVIRNRLLEELILFREGISLFSTVNQPTAVAVISRGVRAGFVVRAASDAGSCDPGYVIDYDEHVSMDGDRLRIPRISQDLYPIYERLNAFPRLGADSRLKNARGELDLSLGRRFVTGQRTKLRLVRGDHVERYIMRGAEESKRDGFIDVEKYMAEFSGSRKFVDATLWRIAGRQVSYLDKPRRLSFAMIPPHVVLANSCNYLTTRGQVDDRALLKALLVVLNSVVIEWYFRIFSSNNHVANYEIDEFPICLQDEAVVKHLAKHADFLTAAYSSSPDRSKVGSTLEDAADALVAFAFGLDAGSVEAIAGQIAPARARRIASMTDWFGSRGVPESLAAGEGWYQHNMPSLSDLDRQVIKHIPQGGNWEDVPESVPSKHIAGIREMSSWRGLVRTSYYGRLRPDQPAYTIATYYNRPGNGTNIHPWEDRTITTREAARLQSFPDSYIFLGPETSVRNQVGNAVPPLLGYAVGRHLRDAGVTGSCIDLFAGAGGLSLGLELAGFPIVAAIDNDARAADTYMFNRPCEEDVQAATDRTLFLRADLTRPDQRDVAMAKLAKKLDGQPVALLVGGPPCQGFSHAGWRASADQRNELASTFMKFVEELVPGVVVIENVEGLLTYDHGAVVRDLLATLREFGYDTGDSPWVLKAECYGVPQMRRRVFLVASRTGLALRAPSGFMQQCRGRRESEEQAELLTGLPYPVTAGEALQGLPRLSSQTHRSMGRRVIRSAYADWAKGSVTTEDLVATLSHQV